MTVTDELLANNERYAAAFQGPLQRRAAALHFFHVGAVQIDDLGRVHRLAGRGKR